MLNTKKRLAMTYPGTAYCAHTEQAWKGPFHWLVVHTMLSLVTPFYFFDGTVTSMLLGDALSYYVTLLLACGPPSTNSCYPE